MKALSPSDAMFLLAENRRTPMHVAGLQLYSLPKDAPPDFIAGMVAQMREYPDPQPPYNLRPVFRGTWFWQEDADFDLDHHLRHLSLPKPGRIRELLAMTSRLHGALMDRSRPLWETNVIEGLQDGRVAMFSKVHHALFDGVGATREARKALSEDPNERNMPPPWARPRAKRDKSEDGLIAPPASPLQNIMEAVKGNVRVIPGAARGFWDLVRKSKGDGADVTPYQAPPTLFNVRISSSRRFAAQSYPLARMKAVAKKCGATLNDIALAMCAGALREYLIVHEALPDKPLIAMVPVSVRAADSPEGGNQVSVILANLATHIADPGKRLDTIISSMKKAKERTSKMTRVEQIAYAAAALSPMMITSQLGLDRIRPAFNIVISNVPGPTKPLYWNGARLDETYPVSIPIDGQALNITLTSYVDQMAFGYTACRRSVPSMQRLLDFTERALSELETVAAG
ncbi:MAG TPA: wax ester/triacylglycerol synthase family O-acyltransferase [Nevskiaceae bacterium]|nr:wax ester/triacylglycerol synthase family O-acyltransferase [Nevskiaceae bacterium]